MVKKIYMFPGQGSQKTGMGSELWEEFSDIVQEANRLLLSIHKECPTIQEICQNSEHQHLLNRTDFTQPLLYLVNALSYQKIVSQEHKDKIFIGHSLGEYNALQAAGAFNILTGFKLLTKRGELMNEVKDGSMAAVLGLNDDIVKNAITQLNQQGSIIEIANFNSPGQIIISGPINEIQIASEALKKVGAKKIIKLPVSGAFHSSLMKPSAETFSNFLKDFTFNRLNNIVYANANASSYPIADDDEQTRIINALLTQQIYSPVLWTNQIQNIKKDFADDELVFEEVGPGQVLTGLVKRIL